MSIQLNVAALQNPTRPPFQPPSQLPIFLPSLHCQSSLLFFFLLKYKRCCKNGNNEMCKEIAWGLGIARSFIINIGGVAVNAFLSIQIKTFVKSFLQQFFVKFDSGEH